MPDNMTSPPPPNPVSSNFFTSKPFIILVLSGIVLCGGIMFFQSLSDKTVLSFSFNLDGKSLPADKVPDVKVDGQAFTSGSKIKLGKHELVVQLQNVEPYRRTFWVFIGEKDLGKLQLETSKGSLVVTVNPSPATVVVQHDGETVTQGAAPLDVEKLPVGNYTLVVKRADYEETRTVDIRRQQTTNEIVELNLGKVELSSIPADAEYEMSGNGHHWQGKLPARLEDVPVGNYTLVVKHGDYEETHTLGIQRQQTTNEIVELNLGKVELSSIPADAEYEMSGNGHRWQGKLPARLEDVPVGDYSLSVTRRDWKLDSDVSAIRGGVTTNITEFPYGSISVTSTPTGLVVSTNGVEIGKTPITLRELKPAAYNLTISDGENDLIATVNVGAKENAEHAFIFHYGTVQLMSEPAGATVIRKGKEIGKTPLTLNHIPVGETMLELQLQDYVSTNLPIQAVEGITNQLSADLVSKEYLRAMEQARNALDVSQFAESQKFIAAALKFQPNDPAAMELQDAVSKAATKAEEARKEAERVAEVARKEAEHNEIIAIIEKAITAHGGRDVLTQFTASREVSYMTGKLNDGNDYSVRATTYIQPPDKIRTDHETRVQQKSLLGALSSLGLQVTVNGHAPDQEKVSHSIYYVSGSEKYNMTDGIIQSLSDRMAQNLSDLCYYDECEKLVPLLDKSFQLERVAEGSDAIKVKKTGKPDFTLFFSEETGLLSGIEYFENEMGGSGKIRLKINYSDYRNFNGMILPTRLLAERAGQSNALIIIEQADLLRSLPDQLFNISR